MSVLSKRVQVINPSPTLSITAKANKMKAEGINVVSFGAGEPDYDTPVNIKNAAKTALDKGLTKYTPTSGIIELKKAICSKLKTDNNLDYAPEQILVSCGAKHSIFNVVLALCGEGDEVLIPSPYWVSYPEMVNFAGAKPVYLQTSEKTGFKITAEQLKKAVTKNSKLFILNSPSNPTGMLYSQAELKEIAKVLTDNNIYCISDEIYEKLAYTGQQPVSIAAFDDKIKNLTITVNGVSKPYAMTGWRIGYAAGPKEIIQAMSNLQDHSTSNPTSIAQYATIEALNGPQDELNKMVIEFKQRREIMVEKVNAVSSLSALMPEGAFYCWVNISKLIGRSYNGKKIEGSMGLTELLLTEAKVAVVPGCVFGDDNYIRLSYATSRAHITEGLDRIKDFTEKTQ
ncbi:MAG: aspartate aminotransferase [Elusimicrobia bacterium RIFOXYA2_FULL_39_19]|nr:MAG: aspartate aminotransferase [Elusimicrobia bacterium RIFOXYA2_FULL_39_19]